MEDVTQINNEPTGHFIGTMDHLFDNLNSHSLCGISHITHNHCLPFTGKDKHKHVLTKDLTVKHLNQHFPQ